MGIVQIVSVGATVLFAFFIGSVVDSLICPVVNIFEQLAVDPLSIPIVNQVIIWASLGGLAVCLIIRIVRGVYELVINPSDKSPTFAEWCVKTVLSIGAVALMPLFCNLVIQVGSYMLGDVQSTIQGTGVVKIEPSPMANEFFDTLVDADIAELGGTIANCVMIVFVTCAIIMTVYQLLKRQIIIYYVTILSSWIAVKAAMDSFDDVVDLLVSLFGLVVTQWVQYLAMAIAIVQVNNLTGETSWVAIALDESSIRNYMLVLAYLGAALGIPAVLERYAFASGRSGAGNMIVGMAVRGGFGSFGKVGRAAGSIAGGIASKVAK